MPTTATSSQKDKDMPLAYIPAIALFTLMAACFGFGGWVAFGKGGGHNAGLGAGFLFIFSIVWGLGFGVLGGLSLFVASLF